jgi:choloylglycine hydrolase
VSRYASLTFNLVGYQYAWAGINEEGLVLSTMSLDQTRVPPADARPPLDSGMWMQHLLDTCATVSEVVATDTRIRIFTVDHYLVADATGHVATVEFLDGQMVVHRGDELPVPVLTNDPYASALAAWLAWRDAGSYWHLGASLTRFCLAADRVTAHPASGEPALGYALDTLHTIRGERVSPYPSQWSLVFDIPARRAHFRTRRLPEVRTVGLRDFRLECGQPIQMLDIQADLSGDVAAEFVDFDSETNRAQMAAFFAVTGLDVSARELRAWTELLESYPCLRHRRPGGRTGS